MPRPTRTTTDTLSAILDTIQSLEAKMPNGELKVIKNDVEELKSCYRSMRQDLSDIKVRLLNPEDGIIVKVNDRMGYKGGNHIDLSKCAFDSIGNTGSGRIKVIVEEIKN